MQLSEEERIFYEENVNEDKIISDDNKSIYSPNNKNKLIEYSNYNLKHNDYNKVDNDELNSDTKRKIKEQVLSKLQKDNLFTLDDIDNIIKQVKSK